MTSKSRPAADLIGLLILVIPPLLWAGNFVVGRAIRNDVPPMALSFGRWVIAFVCLLPFAWTAMRRDLAAYWQHRWLLLRITLVGVVAFNSLIYLGLHTTTAANGLLLNSFIPVLIVLFGAAFYGQRLRRVEAAGLVLSCFGVLTIILHGEWERLIALRFTGGDLIVFSAMVSWAFYTLWLRKVPAEIDRIGLMGAQIAVGLVILLPPFVWEYAAGARTTWNGAAAAALLYVGIFPSVIAYLLYTFGIGRVGPARAGLFIHLIPVFGAILAVIFLGESLHPYHALGMAAIVTGLACSNLGGRQAAETAD